MSAASPPGRPTWAEVDLEALVENYRALRSLLAADSRGEWPASGASIPPRLLPVIKADAYGHGAVPVARALASEGATAFAVAIVEEGVALRDAAVRREILVMEGAWPGQEEELLGRELTPAVHSIESLVRLERAIPRDRPPVGFHLKVDTGMRRMGVEWAGMERFIRTLADCTRVRIAGTFTHLACADEEDGVFTMEQLRRFRKALSDLVDAGLDPGEVHVANSAGLLYWPQTRTAGARPGIALYGYAPVPSRLPPLVRPVLTLKSRLGVVRSLSAGESVGYNRRFTADSAMRVATLPVGYADGFRRSLSGRAKVVVRDRWAPVLGTVSMDMIVVDVTHLPDAREGDEALLLGRTAQCTMDAATWADMLGTIPYDILCGIGPRIPRFYRMP